MVDCVVNFIRIASSVLKLKIIICKAKFNDFVAKNLNRIWIFDKFIQGYIDNWKNVSTCI